jgi:UDP-glucose 4-epimerase
MKIVVLGGGGFVGSHLSEKLMEMGHAVNVFDQPKTRYLEYLQRKGAEIFTGDFLNSADVSHAMKDCDIVFHLISTTVPKTSNDDPSYDVETNVLGTLRMLDEARKVHVKKVVFASSGGTVYGIPQEIPIKEKHPNDPISSYGITKLTIEKYLHLYWTLYGLDYCVLRISNAYGERQPVTDSQGVVSAFLDKVVKHEKLVVWGDGSVIRDYIHVNDIVTALIKAALYEGDHKVFNVGGGKGFSISEVISIMSKVVGESLQPEYNPGRLFDVPVNILDISRAKLHLNWEPNVDLVDGIFRVYTWILEQKTIS